MAYDILILKMNTVTVLDLLQCFPALTPDSPAKEMTKRSEGGARRYPELEEGEILEQDIPRG